MSGWRKIMLQSNYLASFQAKSVKEEGKIETSLSLSSFLEITAN